jgi:hypothetical protein
MSDVTALPRRSPLYPDESLQSLIYRHADLNFYNPTGTLTRLIWQGIRSQGSHLAYLQVERDVRIFQRIATLTKVDVIELFQATAHRYALIIRFPGDQEQIVELRPGVLLPALRRSQYRSAIINAIVCQFCPACLQENAYARLHWELNAVSVCLKHLCLLHEYCPECLTVVSRDMVARAQCDDCGTNLCTAPMISIQDDPFGLAAHQTIQYCLGLVPTVPDIQLPAQSAQVLYHTMTELTEHTKSYPEGKMNSGNRYSRYRVAFQALTNWPHNFLAWLDEQTKAHYPVPSTPRPKMAPDALLRRLSHEKKWQHPAFQFLQDAFDTYLKERFSSSRLQTLRRFSSSRLGFL